MKSIIIATGLLLAIGSTSGAQTPQEGQKTHENGVTYPGYIDHEYTMSDPYNAATATGADQIARKDTGRKFVPYTSSKAYTHRKKHKA